MSFFCFLFILLVFYPFHFFLQLLLLFLLRFVCCLHFTRGSHIFLDSQQLCCILAESVLFESHPCPLAGFDRVSIRCLYWSLAHVTFVNFLPPFLCFLFFMFLRRPLILQWLVWFFDTCRHIYASKMQYSSLHHLVAGFLCFLVFLLLLWSCCIRNACTLIVWSWRGPHNHHCFVGCCFWCCFLMMTILTILLSACCCWCCFRYYFSSFCLSSSYSFVLLVLAIGPIFVWWSMFFLLILLSASTISSSENTEDKLRTRKNQQQNTLLYVSIAKIE